MIRRSQIKKLKEQEIIENKPKPVFRPGNFIKAKIPKFKYGTKNELYYTKIETENATYNDVRDYVQKAKEKLKEEFGDSFLNICMKYQSRSTPISAGFFDINDDVDVIAPYDHQDADDLIEYFYIQYAI